MRYRALTLALTATAVLFLTACGSTRQATSSLRLSSLVAYGLQEAGTPTVSGKLSAVSKVLKWITALICAIVVLIITVKVCLLRR